MDLLWQIDMLLHWDRSCDQTCYFTQSQYTDGGPTSLCKEPTMTKSHTDAEIFARVFTVYRRDRSPGEWDKDTGGGIFILVSEDLTSHEMPELWVKINMKGRRTLLVCCFYHPPHRVCWKHGRLQEVCTSCFQRTQKCHHYSRWRLKPTRLALAHQNAEKGMPQTRNPSAVHGHHQWCRLGADGDGTNKGE